MGKRLVRAWRRHRALVVRHKDWGLGGKQVRVAYAKQVRVGVAYA
jgi:hypothetical protein